MWPCLATRRRSRTLKGRARALRGYEEAVPPPARRSAGVERFSGSVPLAQDTSVSRQAEAVASQCLGRFRLAAVKSGTLAVDSHSDK